MVHKVAEKKERAGTGGKAAFSVDDCCGYLDISRPSLYRLLGEGALPSFHIGRRRLILERDLDKYIEERLAAAGHGG